MAKEDFCLRMSGFDNHDLMCISDDLQNIADAIYELIEVIKSNKEGTKDEQAE